MNSLSLSLSRIVINYSWDDVAVRMKRGSSLNRKILSSIKFRIFLQNVLRSPPEWFIEKGRQSAIRMSMSEPFVDTWSRNRSQYLHRLLIHSSFFPRIYASLSRQDSAILMSSCQSVARCYVERNKLNGAVSSTTFNEMKFYIFILSLLSLIKQHVPSYNFSTSTSAEKKIIITQMSFSFARHSVAFNQAQGRQCWENRWHRRKAK